MRLKSRRVWQFSHDCVCEPANGIDREGFRSFEIDGDKRKPRRAFACQGIRFCWRERGASYSEERLPVACPGASRKSKSAGHSARNDTDWHSPAARGEWDTRSQVCLPGAACCAPTTARRDYSNWMRMIWGFVPRRRGGPQVPVPQVVNTSIFPKRFSPWT